MKKTETEKKTVRKTVNMKVKKTGTASKKKKETGTKFQAAQRLANERAAKLYKNQTRAERKFSKVLQRAGIHFKCQKIYFHGPEMQYFYIADFYIPEYNIIVEVDGKYHENDKQKRIDAYKDEFYTVKKGHSVLRITNERLSNITDSEIVTVIKELSSQTGQIKRLEHYENETTTTVVSSSVETVETGTRKGKKETGK